MDFANFEAKAAMYKQLYEQAASSLSCKDSHEQSSSPFVRSRRATPSKLPQESSSKFKDRDTRNRQERHYTSHQVHASPAVQLRSPDLPSKQEL